MTLLPGTQSSLFQRLLPSASAASLRSGRIKKTAQDGASVPFGRRSKLGFGLILIGMPGIAKRTAQYPQLYSRIGFVHEFLPLDAAEMRRLLQRYLTPPEVSLPAQPVSQEAAGAILRITGDSFRLLNRLLTQIERILEINGLKRISKQAVEAARESLVIGSC